MIFSSWLVKPPTEDEIFACWHALANEYSVLDTTELDALNSKKRIEGKFITIEPLPMLPQRALKPLPVAPPAVLRARVLRRPSFVSWRLASFSSLLSHARPVEPAEISSAASPSAGADDIVHFPRGAAAGEYLHRLFELTDFTTSASWPAAIERVLQERMLPAGAEPTVSVAMMTRLLSDLAMTELVPGLRLATVAANRIFRELEFTFTAHALDLSALRALLKTHGYLDIDFEASELTGYMKGIIDLVFEYAGRFWIADWKSNHLGNTAVHYNQAALHTAMAAHGYHLQALLYTLALHRYLRIKQPAYDYTTHCGGYLYLFVRGVRPDWQVEGQAAGVYHHKPTAAMIDALDRLMHGERL